MSTAAQQPQPIARDEFTKQAAAVESSLVERLYVPALVKAAAAHGVKIETREQLDNAMQIVDMLKAAQHQQGGDLFKQASADLRTKLTGSPAASAGRDQFVAAAMADSDAAGSLLAEQQLVQYRDAGLVG